jgi:hypothetical protein
VVESTVVVGVLVVASILVVVVASTSSAVVPRLAFPSCGLRRVGIVFGTWVVDPNWCNMLPVYAPHGYICSIFLWLPLVFLFLAARKTLLMAVGLAVAPGTPHRPPLAMAWREVPILSFFRAQGLGSLLLFLTSPFFILLPFFYFSLF